MTSSSLAPWKRSTGNLPDIRDRAAWDAAATREDAAAAVLAIRRDVDGPKDEEANALLVRLLIEEGVTVAELAYCTRMLRRDQELGKSLRFNTPIRFFDFARWIYPLRELREHLIHSDFSAGELGRLLRDFPGIIKRSNFGVLRHTVDGDPIYKFFASADDELRSAVIEDALKPFSGIAPNEERRGDVSEFKDLLDAEMKRGENLKAERVQSEPSRSERIRALSSRHMNPGESK